MWQELTGFNFRDVADRALNSQANMSMFTRKANEHFAQCMASLEHYEEKQQLAAVASLTKQSASLTTLAKQVMDARRRRAHMKRAPTPPAVSYGSRVLFTGLHGWPRDAVKEAAA